MEELSKVFIGPTLAGLQFDDDTYVRATLMGVAEDSREPDELCLTMEAADSYIFIGKVDWCFPYSDGVMKYITPIGLKEVDTGDDIHIVLMFIDRTK